MAINPEEWTIIDWISKIPVGYYYKILSGIGAIIAIVFGFGIFIGTKKKEREINKLNDKIEELEKQPRIILSTQNDGDGVSKYAHHLKYSFSGDKYIHPGIVHLLEGWLYDSLPTIAAIDIEGAMNSNDFTNEISIENIENRTTINSYKENESSIPETFGYEYIGVSPDGIHVLVTHYNGGGSGTFYTVLFLKFQSDQVMEYKDSSVILRQRILLKCIGAKTLGDRYDGLVKLTGNQLIVGKRRHRYVEEQPSDILISIN